MTKMITRFSALLFLWLISTTIVQASTACHVNFDIRTDWGNGYTADVYITNEGDAWSGWDVQWTMPGNQRITGLWNGVYQQNGSSVAVANYSWNKNIGSGSKLSFGFNGSYSGSNVVPYDLKVNGVLCTGQAAPPEPEPKSCKVTYDITSEWGSGFVASVVVENTGGDWDGWTATWDMPNDQQITSSWNGNFQQSGAIVQVDNYSWNQYVKKSASINFGFVASHFGINQIPGNVKIDGVLCDGQTPPEPVIDEVVCEVDYVVRDQWHNGFTADVTIKNQGSALDGWEVDWNMPYGQQVTYGWNGAYSQNGSAVNVSNAHWNKVISTDGKIEFGFNGSYSQENPIPNDITLNGVLCDGQPDSIQIRPQAPSNLVSALIDNTNVVLNWSDNSDNEDNFVLERRVSGQNWQALATLGSDVVSYEDATLEIGVNYDFRVKATNASGSSSYTNEVSAMRIDRTDIGAQMLVDNCSSCHGTDGVSIGDGIPTIAGFDATYLTENMQAYRDGTRAGTMMGRIATGYSDEHIELMSEYLEDQTFVAATQTVDDDLVKLGRKIHDENCTVCHTDNGASLNTGSRLAGQWKTYLYAAMKSYMEEDASQIPAVMLSQLQNMETQYGENALEAIAEFYAANPDDTTGYDDSDNGGGTDDGTGDGSGGGDGGTDDGTGDGSGGGDGGTDDGTGDGSGGGDGGTDDGTGDGSGNGGNTTAPTAPSGLSATVVDNELVNLAWIDNSDNETGFTVQRMGIADSEWGDVASVAAGATSYQDASVVAGQQYQFRIVAYNEIGTASTAQVEATLMPVLAYGAQEYAAQGCATWHGVDGAGGITGVGLTHYTADDISSLTQINDTTMPLGNPSACVGNCASSISEYIIQVLAANDNGGNDGTQACAGEPPANDRSLRLLTRYEYQNTVNDLLGLSVDILYELPDETFLEGYDNNVEANQPTSIRDEAFLNKAEDLALQGLNENWDGIVSCNTEDMACAEQFINEFGKKAYRRPLTDNEVSTYLANFSQDAFSDAVQTTVMGMLMSPHMLYRSELGTLQPDGTYELTQYEIASSLSYLFWATMPDDQLMAAADNNELSTAAQRLEQAYRLLHAERSREPIGNFVGQWLLASNPYSLPEKDSAVYPEYTDEVRAAMSRELVDFFSYVTFESTGQYRELFNSDYVVVDQTLADFYGVNAVAGSEVAVTPVADGSRKGILSLGAVLARYSNSNESHPFKRGAFLFERVLCHELPAPDNMGIVEAPEPDPDATTRERFEVHSQSEASCYSCHQYIDGPGFGFENYDGSGQFRLTELGSTIDSSGILRGMETYTPEEEIAFNGLGEMAQHVSESPTASQCFAKQYYRYAYGKIETEADACALNSFIDEYEASGYNLQTMLLGIVNSPNFIQRQAQ